MKLIFDDISGNNPDSYIEYISCGLFKNGAGWQHQERTIDDYALLFVLEGEVYIEESGERFRLAPGDVFVLSPGEKHRGYQKSLSDVSYYWVHFRSDIFEGTSPDKRYMHISDGFQLQNLFKQLLHTVYSETYPRYVPSLYLALIIGELDHSKLEKICRGNTLASEIHEYIRVNAEGDNLTISSIAEHFGYNPDYIGRMFKTEYKIGIKDYIVAEKMNAAKHYLLFTLLSVKEIASRLGFDDADRFIKYFKYHEKITPTNYRNIYSQNHINNK